MVIRVNVDPNFQMSTEKEDFSKQVFLPEKECSGSGSGYEMDSPEQKHTTDFHSRGFLVSPSPSHRYPLADNISRPRWIDAAHDS